MSTERRFTRMYAQIVVPLDTRPFSARALVPATRLAEASDARLSIVNYSMVEDHRRESEQIIEPLARQVELPDVVWKCERTDDIGGSIVAEVHREPGSLVCMASVGRSRTAPVLGSVAESALRALTTPVLLIGPDSDVDGWKLAGVVEVCVDGSASSEAILPIVASWAIVFGLDLRVVSVVRPSDSATTATNDPGLETGYVRRIAAQLERDVGRSVDFDVLHGSDPAATIVRDAAERGAALVAASTHGRTGLRRVTAGSVAMSIVHHARQPVLTYRPLDLLR